MDRSDERKETRTGDVLGLGHDHGKAHVEDGSDGRRLVELHPDLLAVDSHERRHRATAQTQRRNDRGRK